MATPRISPEEANAQSLAGKRMLFIDSRIDRDWRHSDETIPEAIRVPPDAIEDRLGELGRDVTLIVYCTSPGEETSARVAQMLSERGFAPVYVLRGGFQAWKAAGYPMQAKSKAA